MGKQKYKQDRQEIRQAGKAGNAGRDPKFIIFINLSSLLFSPRNVLTGFNHRLNVMTFMVRITNRRFELLIVRVFGLYMASGGPQVTDGV